MKSGMQVSEQAVYLLYWARSDFHKTGLWEKIKIQTTVMGADKS